MVRPTTKEYDSKVPTILKRILGHVAIFVFAIGGIAILFIDPLPFLTCRQVEPVQIDCHLQERIAWLIPVREILITQVQEAYVNEELITREDDEGNKHLNHTYEIILVGASGETGLGNTDQSELSAQLTANRINDYLNTPTSEPLRVWWQGLLRHTVISLLGGLVFIFFGFLSITGLINSGLLIGAWLVEFVLLVVGWVVVRFGLSSEVNEQINRYRQMVRGIAIPPE